MKKTFNINISGYGFVIDEDAYLMLDTYLNTLSEIFRKAGEVETADDIEQRIAEIFVEKIEMTGQQIITKTDVEEIIERMGRPEELVDVEVSTVETPSSGSIPPPYVDPKPIKKKLYRDLNDKVLGGVCSGLGWYLGVDPVWIRVLAVVAILLSATWLIWLYIILWIVIPAARTPYERMQMMGVDPSMQNVGRVVTGQYRPQGRDNSGYPTVTGTDKGRRVGKMFITIASVLALIVVGSLLIAMGVAFIGCILAICVLCIADHSTSVLQARLILGCIAGGAVILGIPLFYLFRMLLGVLTERHLPKMPIALNVSLILFWLLGLGSVITCGIVLGN